MGKTYFSVVIPLYNKEEYIKNTLESVLKQEFKDFEILIIDDGSTDNSCRIVESFNDSRIRLIKCKNRGVSSARNIGIQEAIGEYVAFLDADDLWMPNKLQVNFELLKSNTDVCWCCSGYSRSFSNKTRCFCYKEEGKLNAVSAICNGLKVWTSTVVVRRSFLLKHNLSFNENYHNSEDRELWYKIMCIENYILYTKQSLALYVEDKNGLTFKTFSDLSFSFLSLEERLKSYLDLLSYKDREMFLSFLKCTNLNYLLNHWAMGCVNIKSTKSLNIDGYKHFVHFLCIMSFMPYIIKKILVRLVRKIYVEKYI